MLLRKTSPPRPVIGAGLFSFALLLLILTSFLQIAGAQEAAKDQTAANHSATASMISTMDALNATHKLGAGDRLSIRVIEDEDPPQMLWVTDSGEMEVPHLGRVAAAGKTCKSLAYEVKNSLEKEYYYKATVIIGLDVMAARQASRGRVFVMGQVGVQGPQEIPAEERYTISQAIMRAGGFAQYADKKKVKLVHRDASGVPKGTKIVNLVEIMEQGKTANDVLLEADDMVIVPEKFFNFQ